MGFTQSPRNAGGQLIEPVKTLSGASTYTINVPSGASYSVVEVYISGLGGMSAGVPTSVLIQLNGDSGANYRWIAEYWINSTTSPAAGSSSSGISTVNTSALVAITSASPATSVDAVVRITPPIGKSRAITSTFQSEGSTAATDINGFARGWWVNSVSQLTSITLSFGSPFSGTVQSWGLSV